jgi:hypothetical protein
MKSASEWNDYHKQICFNDPAVHGQLLPNPQMVEFIQQIQLDAMKEGARRAATICQGDSIAVPCDNEQCEIAILSAAGQWSVEDLPKGFEKAGTSNNQQPTTNIQHPMKAGSR